MTNKNITNKDIELSKVYFTLLVEVSLRGETISYGELVELSKKRYKKNSIVQKSLTRTIGRRLEVLRLHTDKFKLSDISSLCVSKGSNKSGDSYHLDSEKERKKVYKTNWLDYFCQVMNSLENTRTELRL